MQTARNPTRKACDLCYRRKIKCDGNRPRCSHCILHNSECTFTAIKRTSRPRNQIPQKQLALQEQVQRLEAQLASTLEQIGEKSQPERMSQRVYEKSPAPSDSSTIGEQDVSSSSSETLHLPPLDELVRAVQTFSENCNWSLPLFHIPTLLRMIHGWYSMPHQRSPVKWAAINVVLALAYHGGSGDLRAADYLSKAQSAMTTIIMDPHPELLNIQVIVGMVAIFQGARDLQPALILIATAMRLIHRLGIHSRRGLVGMDPAIAAQCTRVFWVAYVFDKDLSIRACVPSVQQDDDIDLDLPSDYLLTSDDSWGAFDANAMIRENYLMARVQLARIEGRVYDDMISARSQMWDIDRRTGAALALLAELERWKARLPGPLRICNNVQTVAPDLLRSLSILHAASITCEAHIHVAHAHDEPWTKSLSDYASGQEVQLSTGWQAPGLAHESRQFMTLFNSVPNQDLGFRWIAGCAYFSTMLILLANTIHNPQGQFAEGDSALIDSALNLLEEMIEHGGGETMQNTLDMSRKLFNVVNWKRLLVNGEAENWEPVLAPGLL